VGLLHIFNIDASSTVLAYICREIAEHSCIEPQNFPQKVAGYQWRIYWPHYVYNHFHVSTQTIELYFQKWLFAVYK